MPTFELATGGAPLDRSAPESLHAQISDGIRATIASGQWPAHHKLMAEPELAAELGVSRGTLRRALSTLIEEGLLKQVQGRGTFVTETLLEPTVVEKLSTLSEDFASQGVTLSTTVVAAEAVAPPPAVAALLRVRAPGQVLRLVRVRATETARIALVHNYVPLALAPGIEDADFTATTLFGALEGRYEHRIGTARRTFSAVSADRQVAEALGLEDGAPVQYIEQLTFLADGRPIEYSDIWINSSELRVVTHLARR